MTGIIKSDSHVHTAFSTDSKEQMEQQTAKNQWNKC